MCSVKGKKTPFVLHFKEFLTVTRTLKRAEESYYPSTRWRQSAPLSGFVATDLFPSFSHQKEIQSGVEIYTNRHS